MNYWVIILKVQQEKGDGGMFGSLEVLNIILLLIFGVNVAWLMMHWGRRNSESLYVSALVDSRALMVVDKNGQILSYSKAFRMLFPMALKGESFKGFLNKNKELKDYSDKEFVFELRNKLYLGRTSVVDQLLLFEVVNITATLKAGNEAIRRVFEDFDTSPISLTVDGVGNVQSVTRRMSKYWWLIKDHELSHLSDLGIAQSKVELLLHELRHGTYDNGTIVSCCLGIDIFEVSGSALNDYTFIINLGLVGERGKISGGHYDSIFSILESIDDGLVMVNNSGRIIYSNKRMVDMLNSGELVGYDLQNLISLSDEWGNEVCVEYPQKNKIYPYTWLTSIYSKDRILIEMSVSVVYEGDGFKVGYVISFRDTSMRDKRQYEVFEFVYKDSLTGIYNRHFFQEEIQRLDNTVVENFGLFMVDANGLKVVNDAFGHELGDKVIVETANALERVCGDDDQIIRVGGDEFAALLFGYDEVGIKELKKRLKDEMQGIKVSHVPLSVSVGHAHHKSGQLDFHTLFSRAEGNMYRDKVLSNQKVKEDILNAIFNELVERHPWERTHSLFTADAAKAVAQALDLGDEFSDFIYDVGLYHSIGKIGLDVDVYLDSGSLVENQGKYQSHNEIAFRILSAMPEHSYMAASILYYNENYDGSGKPKGLVGEDIPLASRIIRVVTAFHKSMLPPHEGIGTFNYEEAREHFMSHKGVLYDPKVVDAFFELYDNDIKNKTGLYLYDLV